MDDQGELTALWFATYENYDRIFSLNNNIISIIDDNPFEDNYYPYGKLDDKNRLHVVWCASNRNESNILFGKVTDRVPQIKSATINSSKEIIKANKAPAKTPGWIKG